ncbi:MAG: ribonuclease HI [Proteobacteria bacterium]|jgi:ribonuclease HI|nr:ribonuclease HI [Pseudomonadota bacterium]
MRLVEMLFRGNRVFVEADAEGKPVVREGRASMRYKPDAEQVYHPSPANLAAIAGGGAPPSASSGLRFEAPPLKKAPKRKAPAAAAPAPGARIPGAIVAYTDGACLGNPGPAGLGYVIVEADGRRVQRGEPLGRGTNNVAELTAILRVLDILSGCAAPLVVYTDSTYAIGVLTQGWKAKANVELVAEIRERLRRFPRVELRKVAGHAGVPENELVDDLARRAAAGQLPVE